MDNIRSVTVLYNLPGTSTTKNISLADDDTEVSARAVQKELDELGIKTDLKGINQDQIDSLREIRSDVVFNLVEWTGRETKYGVRVLEILEKSQIHFTGTTAEGFRITGDKLLMKAALDKYNIPTPNWIKIFSGNEPIPKLCYPVIVKPVLEHCGIGIDQQSVVENENDLRRKAKRLIETYTQPVIGEEFIEGDEAHVSLIGGSKKSEVRILPPAVFSYKKKAGYKPVMSYDAKWNTDSWESQMSDWVTEPLGQTLLDKINVISEKCYEKIAGRGYPRIDMRLRGENVYVLEVNNNPGIGWDLDSGITHSCIAAGISFKELLIMILNNAMMTD